MSVFINPNTQCLPQNGHLRETHIYCKDAIIAQNIFAFSFWIVLENWAFSAYSYGIKLNVLNVVWMMKTRILKPS